MVGEEGYKALTRNIRTDDITKGREGYKAVAGEEKKEERPTTVGGGSSVQKETKKELVDTSKMTPEEVQKSRVERTKQRLLTSRLQELRSISPEERRKEVMSERARKLIEQGKTPSEKYAEVLRETQRKQTVRQEIKRPDIKVKPVITQEEFYDPRTKTYVSVPPTGESGTAYMRIPTVQEESKIYKSDNIFFADISDIEEKAKASRKFTETLEKVDIKEKKLKELSEKLKDLEKGNIKGGEWVGSEKDYEKYKKQYDKYNKSFKEYNIEFQRLQSIGEKKGTSVVSPSGFKAGLLGFEREVPLETKEIQRLKSGDLFSKIALGTTAVRLTTGATLGGIAEKGSRLLGFKEEGIVKIPEYKTTVPVPQQRVTVTRNQKLTQEITIPEQKLFTPSQAGKVGRVVGETAPYFIPYFFATEVGAKAGSSVTQAGSLRGGAVQMFRDYPVESVVGAGFVGVKTYPYLKSGAIKTVEATGEKAKKFIELEKGLVRSKRGEGRFQALEALGKKKKKLSIDLGDERFELLTKLEKRRAGEYESALGKIRKAKTKAQLKKQVKKIDLKKLSQEEKRELAVLTTKRYSKIIKKPLILTEQGIVGIEKIKPIRRYKPPKKAKEIKVFEREPIIQTGRYIPKEEILPEELIKQPIKPEKAQEIISPVKESKFSDVGNIIMGEEKFADTSRSRFGNIGVSDTRFKDMELLSTKSDITQRQKVSQKQKDKTMQKISYGLGQKPKQKESAKEVLKSLLSFKQAPKQEQILKTKLLERQAQRTRDLLRVKEKSKTQKPKIFKLPKEESATKTKATKDVLDGFKVFVRKFGKDVKTGEFETLGEARREFKEELLGSLRAGGFIEKGGKKIKINLGSGFRSSKIDPLRVVQKRGTRLSGFGERKEIQMFRKSKRGFKL